MPYLSETFAHKKIHCIFRCCFLRSVSLDRISYEKRAFGVVLTILNQKYKHSQMATEVKFEHVFYCIQSKIKQNKHFWMNLIFVIFFRDMLCKFIISYSTLQWRVKLWRGPRAKKKWESFSDFIIEDFRLWSFKCRFELKFWYCSKSQLFFFPIALQPTSGVIITFPFNRWLWGSLI